MGGHTVLLRALRRALVGILCLFTFAGVSGLWGLWVQQRELDRVTERTLPQTALLTEVAEGMSMVEVHLLRFMGYYESDLSAAKADLDRVEQGLAELSTLGVTEATTLSARVSEIGTELQVVEGIEDFGTLELAFARVVALAGEVHGEVDRLFEQRRRSDIERTTAATARARILSRYVTLGLVVGWVLMVLTLLFAMRRVQNPFEDVLNFMQRAGDKDLTGRLSPSSQDELGELAGAASRLNDTLVDTLGSLRRVAGEAKNRGNNLEVGAIQARQGAEDQLQRASEGAQRAREIESELGPLSELSQGLHSNAEQAASSVEQILAMTEEVRAEMEGITERVTNSTRSVENLSEASTRVAALAGQVGDAARSVSSSAAAIDESTETLSTGASEGRRLAEVVVHKAAEGRDSMAVALRGMERIRDAVDAAVNSFDRLGAELASVGRVTQVIDDIAGRTNLLSLNAAIIASQAGEQGKAFGVVATEIRSLAEKTATSTREIRSLVEGLVAGGREAAQAISAGAERVVEGEHLARNTGELLGTIFTSADAAALRLGEVERAAEGQSQEAARVAAEIRQVSDGVNEIVGEVRQQESRAREVHQDLVEIEQVALQTARAADEQTKGTELITHTMVEVSEISENVDTSIARVGELLTRLREDLEALGVQARKELNRISDIEVQGEGLSSLAGQIQLETSGFRLPSADLSALDPADLEGLAS